MCTDCIFLLKDGQMQCNAQQVKKDAIQFLEIKNTLQTGADCQSASLIFISDTAQFTD